MTEVLQAAALGLGAGAVYALAGLGVVQIYRGSGVLNFAHGAMALLSATLFVRLWSEWDWPLVPAVVLAVGASAAAGLAVHVLVMRPLRDAAQLVRIIATLGVLAIIQQGVLLVFGSQLTFEAFVRSYYPEGVWRFGDVAVGYDRLVLVVIALGLTALLWVVMRVTTFGLSTQAVAEHQLAARALGRSPDLVAAGSWALGGALAGAAGVLVVPISGLAVVGLVLLVVPALAAGLIGGFRSYWLTTIGGLGIGIGQAVLTRYAPDWDLPGGIPDALPFVVIVAVLALRGSAIPGRDEHAARLPRVGRRAPRPLVALGTVVLATAACFVVSEKLAGSLTTTVLVATVGLSLVVVTGLTGQVSLAQFALAGMGGFVAGRLSDIHGWPFPVVFTLGVAGAIAVGFVFALPALRTRGVSLGVATIALGLAVEKVVFGTEDIIGGLNGTPIETPSLFGWDLSSIRYPERYAAVCVVAFGLLAIGVANLRAGRVGRRLLAVRSNERAAASLGVSVRGVKFYAFGLGAGIAAVGGILMGFRFESVQYSQYSLFASLQLVTYMLIGGIGYVTGALIGALQVPTGIVAFFVNDLGDIERWMTIGSGVLLIVVLVVFPDGIAHALKRLGDVVVSRGQAPAVTPVARDRLPPPVRAAGRALVVDDLTVSFGATRAVDKAALRVEPGRVVGLVGANGAGKTTLIDAITGFVPASGRIVLGDLDMSRRDAAARAREGVARCFQTVELFEDLSVRENLLLATERVPLHAWLSSLVVPGGGELPPATLGLVDALGLAPHLDRLPPELAHGTRRLVGVARALAASPSVLLLDEPAAGLDGGETAELGRMLRRVAGEWGVGVLLVEHDVGLVVEVSDEVVVLDFGRVIFTGPPTALRTDEAVRDAYFGAEPLQVVPPTPSAAR